METVGLLFELCGVLLEAFFELLAWALTDRRPRNP